MTFASAASATVTLCHRFPDGALAGYQQFVKQQLDHGKHWVRILGEPIWAERSPGEVTAWARYEALLNVAFPDMAATVVCAYDLREVDEGVCATAELTHPFTLDDNAPVPNQKFDVAINVLLED